MGYAPPPRPPQRRPGWDPNRCDIEMTVRPARRLFRDGFEWSVRERRLFQTRPNPSGFCRYEADAWVKARAAADRIRARHAESKSIAMRTHTEVVSL